MRKWKAEIWMEDTPSEEDIGLKEQGHLSKAEIQLAIEQAKAAIEKEWDGLKVTNYGVYIDKEAE